MRIGYQVIKFLVLFAVFLRLVV